MANQPYYTIWAEKQNIPIYRGYSVDAIEHIDLANWERIGAPAAFVQLVGMEGFTSCYVTELPAGAALREQRHIYQQFLYVLAGEGSVSLRASNGEEIATDFVAGDLFATPLNAAYVIEATGSAPLRLLSVNDAHVTMDIYHHDEDFVFDNPFEFTSRHQPWPDYFGEGTSERLEGGATRSGNLVKNVPQAGIDAHGLKGTDVALTTFELGNQTLASHIADWPVDSYHQAHHHLGGAVLLIVQSTGYTLMWPQSAGVRPFESGNTDRVVDVPWKPGTIFSPPTGWYHQHFNTGEVNARQLAFRGSSINPTGVRRASNHLIDGVPAGYVSLRQGGNLIEYADEDPYIGEDYKRRRG